MDDPTQPITPSNPEPSLKNQELWPSQQAPVALEPIKQPSTVRTVATGDKVFLVFKDQKRWIISPEALNKLGFSLGEEETVSYQRLQQYADGEAVNMIEAEKLREEMGNKSIEVSPAPVLPPSVGEVNESPVENKPPEPEMVNENFYYQLDGNRPEAVFIIPLIQSNYIKRYLETLYENTPIDFKVIVIDQTLDKSGYAENKEKVHLWVNVYRNLGFSKAHNTGAALALREKPKFIVFSNDDIEFMNRRWWQGMLDTFAQDKHIIGVNPDSPRVAMWGYGVNDGFLDIIDYKPSFTDTDYDFLLAGNFEKVKAEKKVKLPDGGEVAIPESFPARHTGVIDAVATWCTAFRTDMLEKIGLWDERFYPGSGEDYDMMARAYSKAYPDRNIISEDQHYRVVGTTKSWAWHHWTKSKIFFDQHPEYREKMAGKKVPYSDAAGPWRNDSEGNFDVWGNYDKNGVKTPIVREKKIVVDPL